MTPQIAYDVITPDVPSPVLLLCDHAANAVPPDIGGGDLGLPPSEMARHIAYDVGARGVTLALAAALGAGAVLTRHSRLVIDPNRGEDDPTLIMRLYDGTIVPANRVVDAAEAARRIAAYHRPYHAAIASQIDWRLGLGLRPVLVAIHSFTPQLRGRAPRPWHIGVLWGGDGRIALPLIARLRAEADLCVGDNEPYSGHLSGDTLDRHGIGRGLPHVLIEIRNDLIAAPRDQGLWATRLAPMLSEVIGALEE